jgi:hypothetical protein
MPGARSLGSSIVAAIAIVELEHAGATIALGARE